MLTKDPEKVFHELLTSGDGGLANELLGAFARGFPIKRLRLLLRSNDPEVAKAGAFIASELGIAALPLVDDFAEMLRHAEARVRHDVLDCVLVCASTENGRLISDAIDLIRDPVKGVRLKTLSFLSRASPSQLNAALPFLGDAHVAAAIAWLASPESSSDEEIENRLRETEYPLRRQLAVAAACRPDKVRTLLLEEASLSDDEDVASFAASELRIHKAAEKRAKRDAERQS